MSNDSGIELKWNLQSMVESDGALGFSFVLNIYRHKVDSAVRKKRFHERLTEVGFYAPAPTVSAEEKMQLLKSIKEEVFGDV